MVSSAARPLQDQKTLVTGGSSASARPTARAFARAGAAVGVNYRSKASAAEELVREIRDQGGEALALKADVSRDDEVRAMFDGLDEAFGRIDILVANAGIQKDAAITNMSLEDWRAVLSGTIHPSPRTSQAQLGPGTHAAQIVEQLVAPARQPRIAPSARACQLDAFVAADLPWSTEQNDNTVGEHQRLVDIVGDEQHGWPIIAPDLEQVFL